MGEICINWTKHTFFKLFFFISITATYSQYYHGVAIGINTTSATFDVFGSSNSGNTTGFHIGYMYERDLSDMLFLRLGVTFNRRAFEANTVRGVTLYKEKWNTDAVEIPINFGHYINFNQRKSQFFVDAGINIAYNNRASNTTKTETIYLDIGADGEIKRTAFGANASIGVLLKKRIKLRVNYYYGLSNMATTENYTWKNKTISIGVNYFLKERELVY